MKGKIKNIKTYIYAFLRWLVLGIIIGAICGVVGAAFAKAVESVTHLRGVTPWLLYFLPLGGIVSVAIYKLCRTTGVGTTQVFESVRANGTVSPLLAPAVFAGSVITHMLGGSAGREGAALQLGGSISAILGKIFKLDEKSKHILTMCGMGALFSAIFGTPIGACVFAIEVVSIGHFCSAAFFPGIISSITAFIVAGWLSIKPERFAISEIPQLSPDVLWRIAVIAIAGAIVSVIFCKTMRFSGKTFKKLVKNDYLRAFIGGIIVVLITLALNTTDYNGGGFEVIARIFETGEVKPEAFILKILLTAITISAGFKGGEIVPTLFIGATLGGALSALVGINAGFGAAVGMAALLCGVTNCPLATVVLCVELFGTESLVFCALSAGISFLLSGYSSLFAGQRIVFSKTDEEIVNIGAK